MTLPDNSWVFISSEAITGFIWALGALFLYLLVKNEKFGLDTKWKKRGFAGIFIIALVTMSMFSGLAFGSGKFMTTGKQEGGHGWGNPALAMGMAMTQVQHVFREMNVLVLGILYAVFQFIGAAAAGVAFIILMVIYNKVADQDDKIVLKDLFKWNEEHVVIAGGKNAIAAFMITLAFLGGSVLAAWPTPFPTSDVSRVMGIFATAAATGFAVAVFGVEGIITFNPAVWLGAFIVKFFAQRKINLQQLTKEIVAPAMGIGTAVVSGLAVYGLINLYQMP